MIAGTPMISWDGVENLQEQKYLRQFEQHMAGGIAFSSSQAAITACLEILGSRLQPISVIMPVNVAYDTLMGVIRSSARPIICDIDEWTFQADAKQVSEALQECPEAVVLLTRPGGMPVAPALLEAVQDVPTICDARMLPVETEMKCTFNVYDISVMVGEGAVLFVKDEVQIKDLKQVRADSKSELSEVCAALAYKRQPQMQGLPNGSAYAELLKNTSKSGIMGFAGDTPLPTYLIKVPDAKLILTHFAQKGMKLSYGSIPVYKYPIARQRWRQEPNYPIAEKVHSRLMLLPNNEGVKREAFLEIIWNVLDQ